MDTNRIVNDMGDKGFRFSIEKGPTGLMVCFHDLNSGYHAYSGYVRPNDNEAYETAVGQAANVAMKHRGSE